MRSRINVAVLIDGLGWGGAEALVPEFVRAASGADLVVSVGYLREKDGSPVAARLLDHGVEPVGLRVGGLLHPSSVRAVRTFLARTNPDVVHTHLGYSDFLGAVAAGQLGLPVVSSVHVTAWAAGGRDTVKTALTALAQRWAVSRTLAVSHAARTALVGHGVPADRVVVVHNGIQGSPRPGAGRQVRAQLGIADDDLVVAMVSVLRGGKGHDVMVEAVTRLRPLVPRLRLLVVGDGPSRAEVEGCLRPLGQTAVMTGHREDVMDVLDAIDVLCLPSRAEAFPTILLEAMAARVPVVASAVGGVPEIVVDGVTGSLVPTPVRDVELAEALLPYLESPEGRAAAGRAGRARFEEAFTAERWIDRTRLVYDDVLGERARPLQRLGGRLPTASVLRRLRNNGLVSDDTLY